MIRTDSFPNGAPKIHHHPTYSLLDIDDGQYE
jgi:hypothetical protein